VYCHSSGPGRPTTVEVVSEFRGYWTGAARVLAKGDLGWAGPLSAGYQAAVAAPGRRGHARGRWREAAGGALGRARPGRPG